MCRDNKLTHRRRWTTHAGGLKLLSCCHRWLWIMQNPDQKITFIFTKLISCTCSKIILEPPTRTFIILKSTWIPTSNDHKHLQDILLKSYARIIKIGWNKYHLDSSNNHFAWSLAFGIASNNYQSSVRPHLYLLWRCTCAAQKHTCKHKINI